MLQKNNLLKNDIYTQTEKSFALFTIILCAFRSLDPPLDDEAEEMLYIRELVASKFYEASTSRSEANDRTSARLEDRSPRVTVRRVDLSAPKFRMSRRRRRADCRSLEYGSDERASPAKTPSRNDSSSSKDSNNEVENEATARDDRTDNLPGRTSSATERELVRARENTCKIQIGPSVHIVDRELTRQDMEDVHISPETSCRANTATYILRHLSAAESPVTSADNEPRKISEAPRKTLRVRLDTSQQGPIVAEAAVEATSVCVMNVSEKDIRDIKDSEQDERIESLTSQAQNCIAGEEKKEVETKIVECLKNTTNQETINSVVNSRADNEILQEKSKNKVKISFRNDMHYKEKGRIFNKNNDVDGQIHLRNEENTVDKIQEENPSDRSKLLSDNDTSKKIDFPRRGNIAPQTYRAMKSSRSRQTQIDERFSNTFDSHNRQDKLYDVTGRDIRHQSFISTCMDDSQINDNLNEVDLYRPCLNDLDTILLSNDRKIERAVRAVENFAEFLSKLEFATHKDKDKQTPRHVNHGEFHHDSSVDKDRKLLLNEPTRSLPFETELKNTDLTVSYVPSKMQGTNTNSQGTSTNTIERKSSSFTKESSSPSKYSKNSMESSVFPASDSSNGSEISRDKVQRPRAKAHLSESSIYKSDVTTFSNIAPVLSSTRTEAQTSGDKHITQSNHHANTKRLVTSQSHVNRVSKYDVGRSQKEYFGNVFAQTLQKDTSEAADRFIAYLLQDEKRSIEKKVADALKESMIAPVAVQKLLDNLRNVESIRKARETETLDILKNILINIQNQTDRETKGTVHLVASESIQHSKNNSKKDTCQTGNLDDAKINANRSNQSYERIEDVETLPGNVADSPIRTNAIEESILQTQVKDNANDIGQIVKKSHDFKKSDKPSSDPSACREKREDAASLRSTVLLKSAQNSKNNSKGNSYSEAESLKQISDICSDNDALLRNSSQNSSTRNVSAKFNKGCTLEADNLTIAENKEDDMNDERRRNESNVVEDKNISQEAVKEIIIETHENITSVNQNISSAKVSEIKDEEIHSHANSSESIAEILEKEDASLHSSIKENIESLCMTKKEIGSQDSLVKEKVGLVANSCPDDSLQDHASLSSAKSSKLSLKEVASHIKQSIIEQNDLVKDTKDDEIRDKSMMIVAVDNRRDKNESSECLKNTKSNNGEQLTSLSSATKLSLKQVASHIEQNIIAGENDLVKDTKNDETCGKSMTTDNRDGIEDSGFLKNTKSNNEEQLIGGNLQKYRIDILSGSNSSISSTLLDYDNR